MKEELEKKASVISDEILVQRLKKSETIAFDILVERYKKKAYFLAYRLVSNKEDAEDLSQEAFIRVYKNVDKFRGDSNFQTWFFRIVINLCRTHLRKRYFLGRFIQNEGRNTDDEEGTIKREIADVTPDNDPVMSSEQRELAERINQAVNILPGQQREVFVLKHYQGLKIEEISQILGLATGTVKVHLFRAVNVLQRELKDLV